ncbi:terpenoid synthase, partial [Clavulina sp. PMI_390]
AKPPSVDPFVLLAPEIQYVRDTLLNLLGSSHPSLSEIASYYFGLGGKQLRPLLVLLFAGATNGFGSTYAERLVARQNASSGSLRNELDVTLTSPYILNDWNPRMPDYTSSFSEPFAIPSLQGPSTFAPSTSSFLASSDPSSSSPSPSTIPLPSTISSNILPTQLRLAQISEMIHVASLLHDDVLDEAATRRGAPSGPTAFGNKLSVLGGDFLLGRTSAALSRLGDHEVVELMSTIIANLIEGEIMQMRTSSSTSSMGSVHGSDVWTTYIRKSYFKTASLMAKSARASVVLGGATTPGNPVDEELKDVAYAYGRNIGIAFQLVDDALDFSPSSELGKPGFGADLKLGLATAPTLFAWEEYPEMGPLINRRFKGEGDVDKARNMVLNSNALARTRDLARDYSNKALEALDRLPPTTSKQALENLAAKVVDR